MDIALTLVVNPNYATTLEEAEKAACMAISNAAMQKTILAPHVALDIIFEGELSSIKPSIATTLSQLEGLDWALQPAEGRKKELILADMDSTMITVECIDELADFLGLKGKVSEITEAAMRDELDFEGALTERVALLKGLTKRQLRQCYKERIHVMPGAKPLIRTMKENGAYAALVSGGFTFFTSQVADEIGFDMNRANVLEIEQDALTGRVVPPICGAQTKLDTLTELAEKFGLTKSKIVAVGDGANDIPMIQEAGLGVAYRAKPKTKDAAAAAVTYNDLTAVLYFQGYKKKDFIS